ncbi:MAG: ATP-binding cassette domain-containing protein, partial [Oscillospiraceae bacterium]|nr:ATP-binding cassette domain-containing protein [Oscillospiraceae bacterium]
AMPEPAGSISGCLGETVSGKSTTEQQSCWLLVPDGGTIRLFGRDYRDAGVRVRVGALIENAGCFPNASVYTNLMMQAINLGLPDPEAELRRVLELVSMEEHAGLRFKKCSLGMKQRLGIAMALLGRPALLILDEPINGLDAQGVKQMREILTNIAQTCGATVLISSHILGELEKIATHYGILRRGRMVQELSARELEGRRRSFTAVKAGDMDRAERLLQRHFPQVRRVGERLQVYGEENPGEIVRCLLQNGQTVCEIQKTRIGLEEYYVELMQKEET